MHTLNLGGFQGFRDQDFSTRLLLNLEIEITDLGQKRTLLKTAIAQGLQQYRDGFI